MVFSSRRATLWQTNVEISKAISHALRHEPKAYALASLTDGSVAAH